MKFFTLLALGVTFVNPSELETVAVADESAGRFWTENKKTANEVTEAVRLILRQDYRKWWNEMSNGANNITQTQWDAWGKKHLPSKATAEDHEYYKDIFTKVLGGDKRAI